MIERIERFLEALDESLLPVAQAGERLDLYAIGRSALMLHEGLRPAIGSTKDFDIVQVGHPPTPLAAKAVELFGKGTDGARRAGLYLELVLDGLPPVPAGFQKRCQEVGGSWQVIRLWRLEIHDLAATKLKCFRPQDREDLQYLCDAGRLQIDGLEQALEAAFLWSLPKDGDPDRERAFANLERVRLYLEGKSRTL